MIYAATMREFGFYDEAALTAVPRGRPRFFPAGTPVAIGEVHGWPRPGTLRLEEVAEKITVMSAPAYSRDAIPMRMLRVLTPLEALAVQAD